MANNTFFLFHQFKLLRFQRKLMHDYVLNTNRRKLSTSFIKKQDELQLKAPKVDKKEHIETQPAETKNIVTKQDPTDAAEYKNMRSQGYRDLITTAINPYKQKYQISTSLKDFVDQYKNLDTGQILKDVIVSVAGRVMSKREFGTKLLFYDLNGQKVDIQVMADVFHYSSKEEFFEINNRIRRGDIISCNGHPAKTKRGELSIVPTHIQILSPCFGMLPHPHYGLKDKETRYRKRYLDNIMNKSASERLALRNEVCKYLRYFLDQRGFTEVPTPVIHTAPGGATAKPFITHHNDLKMDLYLRISPELKLKEVLMGEEDAVYEIGPQFRNEGIDLTHNPEFTSCEFYQAYKDYNDLMNMIEILFSEMINSILKSKKLIYHPDGREIEIDFTPPFERLNVLSALQEAIGVELPEPSEYYQPEANKKLSYFCTKDNIECRAPRTTKRLLDKLIGYHVEKKCINPTFLYDFPEIMSPLAKGHHTIPGLSERFELYIAGMEVVNAYTEENNPFVLRERFNQQAQDKFDGDEEAQLLDEYFIEVLEHGLKPCAGAGIGIERLLMILADKNNIKDVLPFPMMKPETNIKQN